MKVSEVQLCVVNSGPVKLHLESRTLAGQDAGDPVRLSSNALVMSGMRRSRPRS